MLFLFNDTIAQIEAPEIHLLKRGTAMGCRDPHGLRAREAVEFARLKVEEALAEGGAPSAIMVADLAALIIAKTGANAALFPVRGRVVGEPRLTIIPEAILETLRQRLAADGGRLDIAQIWPRAA